MNTKSLDATPSTPEKTLPKRVKFFLLDPRAEEVFLAGSFNNWNPAQTPLINEGRGRWVREVPLFPGRYEYQFVVDGHWRVDPSVKETAFNTLGGLNSVVVVSSASELQAAAPAHSENPVRN